MCCFIFGLLGSMIMLLLHCCEVYSGPPQFTLHFAPPSGQYSPIVREGSAPEVDCDHATYGIEEYMALKVSAVFIKPISLYFDFT